MEQLTHYEIHPTKRQSEIVVVADSLRTPENVGMTFRICEAFGVKSLYFIGETPNTTNKKVQRTARNTVNKVTSIFNLTAEEIIAKLKQENHQLIGLEITKTSIPLMDFKKEKKEKIALFIGAERTGISENILKELDGCVHINLFGENSSINVVNALSIGLYEWTKKLSV